MVNAVEDYGEYFYRLREDRGSWLEALDVMCAWERAGFRSDSIEHLWAEDGRSLIWRVRGHPELGMIVFTP